VSEVQLCAAKPKLIRLCSNQSALHLLWDFLETAETIFGELRGGHKEYGFSTL
jgi:hypothetical protein